MHSLARETGHYYLSIYPCRFGSPASDTSWHIFRLFCLAYGYLQDFCFLQQCWWTSKSSEMLLINQCRCKAVDNNNSLHPSGYTWDTRLFPRKATWTTMKRCIHSLSVFFRTRCAPENPGRLGGGRRLQVCEIKRRTHTKIFLDTVISLVLRDLLFSWNQRLKLADDRHFVEFLDELKMTKILGLVI